MKNSDMKLLIVGSGNYTFYEVALIEALKTLGYNVDSYYTRNLYYHYRTENYKRKNLFKDKLSRFENKYEYSVYYNIKINNGLKKKIEEVKPTHVFFYNTRCFDERVIEWIKKKNIKVIAFSNDDPFSVKYPKYFWRKFLKLAQLADFVYAYREVNVKEYYDLGCKLVKVWKPYYMKERNFPVSEEDKIQDSPDVVYIGHLEGDERVEWLNYLVDNGIRLGVRAEDAKEFHDAENLVKMTDTFAQYNTILSSAKIVLVFLSKKNRDTYTRRCFEIPAAKSLMMSIYTDDLAAMFEPDKEAIYFRSKEEMLEKVWYYLANEDEREKIATNGHKRLLKDGHDIIDRAKEIICDIQQYLM